VFGLVSPDRDLRATIAGSARIAKREYADCSTQQNVRAKSQL
jgi:hypothetical protein